MNPAQAKRLGYSFEVDCVTYLQDEYPEAHRNGNMYGPKDRGDIGKVTDWTLQCKNTKVDQWSKWFPAVVSQSEYNQTRWWAVVRKVRGKNVREALFVMPFWKGKELMAYLRDLEDICKALKAENRQLKARIKELEA